MSAANTTKWIGIGLLGLPVYGVLTFLSSLDPQPDPNTDYEAWAYYVSTTYYVLKHLFASILGMIFALFGTFARHLCLRSLPRKKPRRTPGVGSYGHHRFWLRPFPYDRWGFYLRFAR